jgi:DNA-directed RNA polymerase subunit alpha
MRKYTKEEVLKAFDIIEKYKEQELQKIKEIEVEADKRSILILGLNTRELNSLKAYDIETIGELLDLDRFELRKFRNIGKKGIDNINKKLKDFGIETPDFRTKK